MKTVVLAILIAAVLLVSGCVQPAGPQKSPTSPSPEKPNPTPQPVVETPGKICPAICVPLWTIQNNNCIFNECGSGCGADGITTFETEVECKLKIKSSSSKAPSIDYCDYDSECVPAECCHPNTAVNKFYGPECEGVSCTAVCSSVLDCGRGKIICISNKCTVIDTFADSPSPTAIKSELPNFLRAAHFVDSFPKHGDTLTQPPLEIVVNFNFVIKPPTSATVLRNGVEIPSEMKITNEEYTLRVDLKGAKEDGIYTVKLNACWPDKSCHDGQIAFTVDSAKTATYKDFRGKTEVTVNMKDILFDAPNIVINKGTKVTWINNDDVEHFINTDPHPTHNSLETLNSKTLKKGDSYSFTFAQAGEFGYHCSAHSDSMTGKIVVV